MEWLKKLSSAIAYNEENLDKEISYDKAISFSNIHVGDTPQGTGKSQNAQNRPAEVQRLFPSHVQ